VDGVLYGTIIANITGEIVITDDTNFLQAVISFNPDAKSLM